MSHPDLAVAVQLGVREALLADPDFVRLQGNAKLYDRVPIGADLPYTVIGDDEISSDANTCFDSSNVLCAVHVWTGAVGKVEAKRIGGFVKRALDKLIDIDGHDTVAGGFETEVYRPGPDGVLTEGVLLFRYLIDPID